MTTNAPTPITLTPQNATIYEHDHSLILRVRIPGDYIDLQWPYSREQVLSALVEECLPEIIRLTQSLDLPERQIRALIGQSLPQYDGFLDEPTFIAWAVRLAHGAYILSETVARFSDALAKVCKKQETILDFILHSLQSCEDLNSITVGTREEVEQRLLSGARRYVSQERKNRNQGTNFGKNFVSLSPYKTDGGEAVRPEDRLTARADGSAVLIEKLDPTRQWNGHKPLSRKPDWATKTRPEGRQTAPTKRDQVDALVRMELTAEPLTWSELLTRLQAQDHEAKSLTASLRRLGATRGHEGGPYSLPISERIAGDTLLRAAAGDSPVKWSNKPKASAPSRPEGWTGSALVVRQSPVRVESNFPGIYSICEEMRSSMGKTTKNARAEK